MILKIINSTNGQFLGFTFHKLMPIILDGVEFIPDYPPKEIEAGIWRYFNSNYSFDAQEL